MQFLEASQSVEHLTRSCINLLTLIEISPTWDEFLTKLSYNGIKVKLSTRFDEMLKHNEQLVAECVKKKIRTFVKDTKLIWYSLFLKILFTILNRNQSSNSDALAKYDAREYAMQLVAFLDQAFNGTFAMLSVEQQEILQTIAFIEINNTLVVHVFLRVHLTGKELLGSDSVKYFSGDGMRQLDADLSLIENFADRTIRVKNPKDLLGEIRQIINLFVSDHTNELLDASFRISNYGKLTDAVKLVQILEK